MSDALVLGSSVNRPVQKRQRRGGWSAAKQQCFLDMLAGTCNVRLSARTAGLPLGTLYRQRRLDRGFAELWREALVLGYERLETELLARALHCLDATRPGEGSEESAIAADAEVTAMDYRLIEIVLKRYRAGAERRSAGRMAACHVATEEETDAALLKQLAVLGRQVRNRL